MLQKPYNTTHLTLGTLLHYLGIFLYNLLLQRIARRCDKCSMM